MVQWSLSNWCSFEVVSMGQYIPEVPRIIWNAGRDGKMRLYLIANNMADIELMLHLCGLFSEGIREQHDAALTGYFRIIKKYEIEKLNAVFPII